MTYAGGTYPSVSGQPPHLATQYAFPASTSCMRASCSPRRRIITTLPGSASAMISRRSFPLAHFSQYGFVIAAIRRAPERWDATRTRNSSVRKRNVGFCVRESFANTDGCKSFIDAHVNFCVNTYSGSEALARLLPVSSRLVPVGAGRVVQLSTPCKRFRFNTVSSAAFQRGSA